MVFDNSFVFQCLRYMFHNYVLFRTFELEDHSVISTVS